MHICSVCPCKAYMVKLTKHALCPVKFCNIVKLNEAFSFKGISKTTLFHQAWLAIYIFIYCVELWRRGGGRKIKKGKERSGRCMSQYTTTPIPTNLRSLLLSHVTETEIARCWISMTIMTSGIFCLHLACSLPLW